MVSVARLGEVCVGRGGWNPSASSLVDEWERIFAGFDKRREAKFELMLDLIEAWGGGRFTLLELGSGPGASARRVLARFPRSRVVNVDSSSSTLRIGEVALARFGKRTSWVAAELEISGWERSLPVRRVDIAVSSYALHALSPKGLWNVYRTVGRLLRPGGLLINSDFMGWGKSQQSMAALSQRVQELRSDRSSRKREVAHLMRARRSWEAQVRKIPELRGLINLAPVPGAAGEKPAPRPTLDPHLRFLHRAGFRSAEVLWQDREVRMVVALR